MSAMTPREAAEIVHVRATSPAPDEVASAARIVIEHSGRYPTDHPMAHALAIMQQLTEPSVATPPQRQPENFDRTPGVGCAARDGGEHWPGAGRDWRECIDCDEWPYAAAPPAEGEAV